MIDGLEPIKKFCEVIRIGMGLDEDQVYIYNSKFNIPPDDRLYIAVGIDRVKSFGSSSIESESSDGMIETQSANMVADLSLDMLSKSDEALRRKEEIIMALRSIVSKNSQIEHGFLIAGMPNSLQNLSGLEGSSIPYRFNLNVKVQYMVSKIVATMYYDTTLDPIIKTEN